MNELRKIRILFPPLVLIASVAFGDFMDRDHSLISSDKGWEYMIAFISNGALVLLAGGYLIGSITEAIYCVLSRRKFLQKHFVSDTTIEKIQILLNVPNPSQIKDKLYPSAVFDHSFIDQRVHEWIQRRWQTCYTSINCFIALIIALIFGAIHPITIGWAWIIFSIVFSVTLIIHAIYAWQEVINMIEYEASRQQ